MRPPQTPTADLARPHAHAGGGVRARLWSSARAASTTAFVVWLGLAVAPTQVTASDHGDGPVGLEDPAVDLGDLYAWPTADGRIAVALTMAGTLQPGQEPRYDTGVLYAIHIDYVRANNRWLPDQSLYIQFGTHPDTGETGVRVRGIPGTSGNSVSGPLEQILRGVGGARVWAGVRDEPSFHDAEGWANTLSSGAWALDPSRDANAGTNTVAVIIEFETAALDRAPMRVWATAGRW